MTETQYIFKDRETMYSPMEDRMSLEDPFSSLMLIDIMATELCNLTCEFCPRAHGYPNLNLHMDLKIVEKVARDLSINFYQNRILYCGFGESLLYNHLTESIQIFKKHMPWQRNIHLVTNGDKLTYDKILELTDAGLNKFFVSMYDGPEQEDKFKELFLKAGVDDYILQHYYKPPGLALFDLFEETRQSGSFIVHLKPSLCQTAAEVRLACLVRHRDDAAVGTILSIL